MIAKPRRGTLRNTLRTVAWLVFAVLFASLVMAAGVMIATIVAGQARQNDLRTWADLGQACGAFSAITAVAALGAFVFTFSAQQREAREHRAELQLQRQALANSERELRCAAETGLSMYHFQLLALSINNTNLAAVWPATEPSSPDDIIQQNLYCTLVLEGIWLNARVGRFNDADVRAAVTYLLTSAAFRRYWEAFRSKRELAATTNGPESQYFKIVDEIYAETQ
jgi:Family of unknown function (DUF6082)